MRTRNEPYISLRPQNPRSIPTTVGDKAISRIVIAGCRHPALIAFSRWKYSEEQGFAYGGGMPDDFKHFLEMHLGMSIEEALHRFRDEQKAKQRLKGPKLY